jgi:hypothetical protein
MSTPFYLIAHRVLPDRAAKDPTGVWEALSGAGWSMWLAMVGQALEMPVRGIGVEGAVTGSAVNVRAGIEMIALYFPKPAGPGEPFYAVLARPVGGTKLRSFVFELGISDAGEPLRVVMAEWRTEGESVMRLRFDAQPDASLEACLGRTAAVMNESKGSAQAAWGGATGASTPRKMPTAIIVVGVSLAVAAIVGVLLAVC